MTSVLDAPKVTFDGVEATYSGPSGFDIGTTNVTVDATAYSDDIAFIALEVADDSMSIQEIEAAAAATPGNVQPPWSGATQIMFVGNEEVSEVAPNMFTEGRWLFVVVTSPGDTNRAFPAAVVEVK